MPGARVLPWIIAVIAAVRALWTSPQLAQAWAHRAGWPMESGLSPEMITALNALPVSRLLMWTVYVLAYLATAVLLVRKDRRAIWTAGTAVLLDFGYWSLITLLPLYSSVYSPAFTMGDLVINLASLSVLGGTIFLVWHWGEEN